MAANPVLLIVAGVAAATFAITALTRSVEEDETVMDYWNERNAESVAAMEEMRQKTEELREARESGLGAELAQADNTARLGKELYSLADANGFVEEANRARVDFILGELNNAYGTEYSMVDGIIQQYGEWRGEIENLAAAKRASTVLDFWEAEYTDAVSNLPKLREIAAEHQTNLDTMQADMDAFAREYPENFAFLLEAQEEYGRGSQEVNNAMQSRSASDFQLRVEALQSAIENEQQLYNQANANLENAYNVRHAYERAATELANGNYQEVSAILDATSLAYAEEAEAIGVSEEQKTQALAQIYSARLSAYAQYAEELKNQKAGRSAEELDSIRADAEKAQAAYLAAGDAKVDAQIQGIDGKTLDLQASFDRLSAAGIECINNSLAPYAQAGAQVPQAVASGIQGSTALQDASAQMAEGSKATADTAIASGGFAESGAQIAQETADGVQASTSLPDASAQMVQDTKVQMDTGIAESNFDESGQTIAENISSGVKNSAAVVQSVQEQIARARLFAAAQVAASNFPAVGTQMINGITAGVNAGSSGLMSAMQNAINSSIAAAKKAADIRSPSHRFEDEVGMMMMRGGANGVIKGIPVFVQSITTAMEAAHKAATGAELSYSQAAVPFTNAQLAAQLESAMAYRQSRAINSLAARSYNTTYTAAAAPTYIDNSVNVGDIVSSDPLTPSAVSRSIEDTVAFYGSTWRIP